MAVLSLSCRPYRLPFRSAVRTARGAWAAREGLIIRLEDERGATGWGEAAVLPEFGTESLGQAEAACRALGPSLGPEAMAAIPPRCVCLRHALRTARAELGGFPPTPPAAARPLAALLPAGRAGRTELKAKSEAGFRTFKWKVGAADPAAEFGELDELCGDLPAGGRLRLDANGAWDRRLAERWLERCAERPVEFLEQPIAAGARGAEDLLLGLASDYPTPIALDESLAPAGAIERWLESGWPGVFVVKPSLLPDADASLSLLAKAGADVVFSSALETAVGARSALRAALGWTGPARPLGFGVWPLFADARFDGPPAAPFLRPEDLARLDPQSLWSALS